MLTLDFQRLGLRAGCRVLDLGCGDGRHIRATRLVAGVAAIAVDLGDREVAQTAASLREMDGPDAGPFASAPEAGAWLAIRGDALRLPFADGAFDCVILSEVLEHLPDDHGALREVRRILRPGGTLGLSVPRLGPEAVCWGLSHRYRNSPGGHLRIYRRARLRRMLNEHGFEIFDHHFAHALHSPYWWLKCAVGLERKSALVDAYHRLLVWDMFERPRFTRTLERLLDPLIGKSEVFYATRNGGFA